MTSHVSGRLWRHVSEFFGLGAYLVKQLKYLMPGSSWLPPFGVSKR